MILLEVIGRLRKDTLYQNSFSLMLSSAISALFGFIFWVVIARTFNTGIVGLATTLISMSSLIALLGLIGFDTIFIRFLARSDKQNDMMNTGFILTGLVSACIAAVFCMMTPLIVAPLSFLSNNILFASIFVVVSVFTTWVTLINAVLIANRMAIFVLVSQGIAGILKLALALLFHGLGPVTIFSIFGLSQICSVFVSFFVVRRKLGFRPTYRLARSIVSQTKQYGAASYVANLLNLVPDSLLPLIVVSQLGAHQAAYFYIAFTIANLLYTIAFSTTQSAMAEAVHDEKHLWFHLRKSLYITFGIMIPSIIAVYFISPYVLSFFGAGYREGATDILRILSISGIGVALYSAIGIYFKLKKDLRGMMVAPAVNGISIIVLAWVVASRWHLNGIGWAWLIGTFASVISAVIYIYAKRLRTKSSFKKPESF